MVAAFVQEMAEEDMAAFWEQTLAAAHARGSLFSSLSVHLWRGYMLWHRGRLPEALGSVMTSNELSEAWGAPQVGVPYGHSYAIGILLEQGDVAAARAYVDRVWDIPRFGDGGRLVQEAHAKVLAGEGRYAEALEMLEVAARTNAVVSNPVWRPWRTYRAPVLAAARARRGGPLADGRGGRALAPVGRSVAARPQPARRGRAGRRRRGGDAARGVRAAGPRVWPATSSPGPSWQWPG